jgi:hypothetical protein
LKALPSPPSYPLLPEGKPENIMDNPYVIEFIERLLKQPYRIGEERQDGSPAEIPKPIFIDIERMMHNTRNRIEHVRADPFLIRQPAVPFFCIDRYVMVDFKNGQLEARKRRINIAQHKKRTWMNLDMYERK